MRQPHKREDGFALLMVLWALAALSLIAGALLMEARGTAARAAARTSIAGGELLLDAAIERAILAIDDASEAEAWPENGVAIPWNIGGAAGAIAIQDEAGKIDAFAAPDLLITAALKHIGLEGTRLSAAETALRQMRADQARLGPLLKLRTLESLGERIGLTREEVERLAHVMTVRTGLAGLDAQVANAETLLLLPTIGQARAESFLAARAATLARADAPERPASPLPAFTLVSPRSTFSVRAELCTADGFLLLREAVVRRTAPGYFARLEERSPIAPRYLVNGCGAASATPA